MRKSLRAGSVQWLLTLPSLAWLGVFFVIPCALVLLTAFRPADVYGGVGRGWTTENLTVLRDPAFVSVLWRTVWVSAVTTLACLALALPVSLHMARCGPRQRQWLLLLIVIPFLSNFLIRVFAWKSLLHPEGPLTRMLAGLGILTEHATLLNHVGTVLLLMIYTQLPFAILPLYAAAEKFDLTLLDAARDLGAGPWCAFVQIFVPGVRRGLLSAAVMVFVCSLGQYVIPQFVGGVYDEMFGNQISRRVFAERNLPQACVLAGALMLAVIVPMLASALWQRLARREAAP